MASGKHTVPQCVPAKRHHSGTNDGQSRSTQSASAKRACIVSPESSNAQAAGRSARFRLSSPTRLRALEEARQRALEPGRREAIAQARQRAQAQCYQATEPNSPQFPESHENNSFNRSIGPSIESDDATAVNNTMGRTRSTNAARGISPPRDMSYPSSTSPLTSYTSSSSLSSRGSVSSISSTDSESSVDAIIHHIIIRNHLRRPPARRGPGSGRQPMPENLDSLPTNWSFFKDVNWGQRAKNQPQESKSPFTN
ncbi:hypothetical protein F5Y06DRAFT_301725 [Hypoxylon sp. FL0890]|nr:hypothetical protein F5Y06DRAFT_301725 [Hypoxylon sp. FL0890]